MRNLKNGTKMFLTILFILLSFPFSIVVKAHEPIFGLGVHTLRKNGIGTEIEFSFADEKKLEFELEWGLTPNFQVGGFFELPLDTFINRVLPGFRGKFRFWRYDGKGLQDSASFNLVLTMENTGTDVSFAHETRRFYFFSFAVFLYDFEPKAFSPFFGTAFGIRPFLTEYNQPVYFEIFDVDKTIMLGPSAFITFGNFALEGRWATSGRNQVFN